MRKGRWTRRTRILVCSASGIAVSGFEQCWDKAETTEIAAGCKRRTKEEGKWRRLFSQTPEVS